jgi:hypothetical protein
MTALGFNQRLCVLPFDHRGSFQTEMVGWEGMLQQEQTNEIAATKLVVYDALGAALEAGVPRDRGKAVGSEKEGFPCS